jgi:hypothetical protein
VNRATNIRAVVGSSTYPTTSTRPLGSVIAWTVWTRSAFGTSIEDDPPDP